MLIKAGVILLSYWVWPLFCAYEHWKGWREA